MRWDRSWVRPVATAAAIVLAAGSTSAGDAGSTPGGATVRTAAVWTAPPVDLARLLDEDRRADPQRPWRVGRPMAVGLTPAAHGVWDDAPSGERIWRLTVRSAGALWLVLGFDVFDLPEGSSLRLFDAAGRAARGPLTAADRQPGGGLWLPPIPGEALTLELIWPARLAGIEPALRLATLSHGYRPVAGIGNAAAAPLAAAACNVDVSCPLGAPLDDARRGVVRLLIQGSDLCSGVLVNNTSLDCQPYVLTANHCYDTPGNLPINTVFLFNFEHPACGGGSPPPAQTISGASPVAASVASDFKLMKLFSSPLGFDVFFNGWSRSASSPTSGSTIHHPDGDVKKIAHDAGPIVNGTVFGSLFWRVNQWDQGTTENGSSGAPLFDQNRRVVGQLRGGASTPCIDPKFSEFGKLSVSWIGGGTSTTRLSDALDPGSTGVTTLIGMDGSYCGALAPLLDISGWSIDDGSAEPGELFQLVVDVRNDGPLAATAVSGVLTTSDPGVAIVDGQASWPDILASQTATTIAPHFKIELAPEVACASAIPFQLALSSGQGNFTRDLLLRVGTDTGQRNAFFSDNMESGTNGWTVQALAGSNPWVQSTADSLSPTKSWRVLDPGTGPHDSVLLMPSVGTLPANAVLRFSHRMQSETGFDGGVLELSTDGVAWQDAGAFITQGGYVGAISLGSGSLAGRDAWTGDLGGWLPVEVDLASFAGQTLRARWRFATNNFGGAVAWAVDDVVLETRAYVCPLFPGARCRGTRPQPGGGLHRSHTCGAPRPQPAPHP